MCIQVLGKTCHNQKIPPVSLRQLYSAPQLGKLALTHLQCRKPKPLKLHSIKTLKAWQIVTTLLKQELDGAPSILAFKHRCKMAQGFLAELGFHI
ncbi:MAG: hypothetical protein E6R11_04220 [Rhodocyclaceae bacterium]|nr:MAG: hypothetical protein E6R11_04220 [Rhodocyclaceae bacterium]